jgi:hypothetical protein
MGLFSRLFKRSSYGAPMKYSCKLCGKKLHGGTGGMLVGTREQTTEHIMTRVYFCTACKETYCPECSMLECRMKCTRCGAELICPANG